MRPQQEPKHIHRPLETCQSRNGKVKEQPIPQGAVRGNATKHITVAQVPDSGQPMVVKAVPRKLTPFFIY